MPHTDENKITISLCVKNNVQCFSNHFKILAQRHFWHIVHRSWGPSDQPHAPPCLPEPQQTIQSQKPITVNSYAVFDVVLAAFLTSWFQLGRGLTITMISKDSSIILWRRHQKQFHSLHRLLNVNTYTPSPRAMSEVCHDALWRVWHVVCWP